MPLERINIEQLDRNVEAFKTWKNAKQAANLFALILEALILLDQRSAHCPMCVMTQGDDNDNPTNT